MQPTLTITLNPALDVTTSVDQLRAGVKLRCAAPRYDPGGGGVNVSRTIKELGGQSSAFVALAGASGQQLRRMVEGAGIDVIPFETRGETRLSFKVFDRSSDELFRFVLPGPEQDPDIERPLLDAIGKCLRDREYRFVVASGSLPPGLSTDLYARLAEQVRTAGGRLILDTSGPALEEALGSGLYLVKPDRQEAEALLRRHASDVDRAEDMARELRRRDAAEVVIVTLGAEGAVVVSGDNELRIKPPRVQVRSPVGAGDSFIGALTWALACDWPLAEACRYGVAAAAAAVTTEATELAHKAEIESLYQQM